MSCVISSTNSGLPFPHCLRAGLVTILRPTSCCGNATSLLDLASFYLLPSNRSPSGAGSDWPRARTSRGSSRGSGPAPHRVFPHGWVRSLANLNEFFVHHEDVRRANGHGPRSLTPAMDAALWRNVRRGSHYLSRRLEASGLEIVWTGTDERDGSARRADCSTQRSAGRTPPLCLRAPGCRAGRGEWTAGGSCGGVSHALRHVSRCARMVQLFLARKRRNGTVKLSNPRAIFAGSPPRFTRSRVTYEAYVVSRPSTRPQVDSAVVLPPRASSSVSASPSERSARPRSA